MMHFHIWDHLIFIFAYTRLTPGSSFDNQQVVVQQPEARKPDSESTTLNVPKIAIVGGGITEASLAHHLHQKTRLNQPLDITVFKSNNPVGGRIRSAYIHDDRYLDVECGAATFTKADWCLKEAMQEVGLRRARDSRADHSTSIWDGYDLLMNYDGNDKPLSSPWWHSANCFWRHGFSLRKTQAMFAKTIKKFSSVAAGLSYTKLSCLLEGRFWRQELSETASSFFERAKLTRDW